MLKLREKIMKDKMEEKLQLEIEKYGKEDNKYKK